MDGGWWMVDGGWWTVDDFNLQLSTLSPQPLIINQICMAPHFWVLLHKFLR